MAASSVTLSSLSPHSLLSVFSQHSLSPSILPFQHRTPAAFPLRASRRPPNFPQEDPTKNWNREGHMTFSDDEEEEEEEEEEEDRSLDLLIRFVENVFRKISKRARKSVRSVLPLNIPSDLVGFSVNGVIILAFFWILKAFLEVVCTLGSVVFVSILLVRGVWTGISYFQQGRSRTNDFDDNYNNAWTTGTQPVS